MYSNGVLKIQQFRCLIYQVQISYKGYFNFNANLIHSVRS